jgi:O-antigen/teichoic acid export membrane protein
MSGAIRRNFLFIAVSNLLAPLFSVALVMAIARVRGAEDLGKYSLVMTVFVLGQSIAGFGLPVVLTREVARARASAGTYLVHACLLTTALLAPLLLIAAATLALTVDDPALLWALLLVLAALLPTSITQYGEAVLLAFERAGQFVLIGVAETVLRALAGTALVLAGHGIVAIAGAVLVLRGLAVAAFVVVLRRGGVRFPLRFERGLWRELVGHIPVLGTIPVVNALNARADVFVLSSLVAWTEVGIYSVALRVTDFARMVPPAYARAVYPVLSRLRAVDGEAYAALARRAVRDVLLLFTPVSLLLFALADVVVMPFGPTVADAATSLRVLAWTLVPMALAVTLAQMLFSANRQAIDLRVNLICTVFSVGGCLLLVPILGVVGAAAAVLASTTIYAALQYHWVRRHVVDPAALGVLARLAVVTLVAVAVTLLPGQTHPWIGATAGLVAYGAGLVSSGLLTRWEIEAIVRRAAGRSAVLPAAADARRIYVE